MRTVRQLLAMVEGKRASARLISKLRQMTLATMTADALLALDDEADLAELIRFAELVDHDEVMLARSRHGRACGIAFDTYEQAVKESYGQAQHLPMDEFDFVFVVVQRRDVALLRGRFVYLRPIAEAIISDQKKAQTAWLRTVAASYAGYASVVARVMVGEVADVA